MDVRAQISMMFHLDKCIGCHTCSIACKNVWTDRKGAEYMWWNNVETKPGTGYPTLWEDQNKYRGGWEKKNGTIKLKSTNKFKGLFNIFHNPYLPNIDDYYEPFTYRYQDLFDSPEGTDQPTARPISMITGEPMDINAGPNWDDDLSGSPVYAKNDPNLQSLSEEDKQRLFEIDRVVFFYLPRICNHCLNPACVASCPSGALYKRGEDGIVLINQEVCRGWRYCVSACPYKKTYYNWATGKSEKCILCYPRLESGQAPACMHSCVGRIRYLGVMLYDADRLIDACNVPDEQLVDTQKEIILDPFNEQVISEAKKNGLSDDLIDCAQNSPVYKFYKLWGLALPLHPEFRTLPMLFYVPPLLPVMASMQEGSYDVSHDQLFTPIDKARIPIAYLAKLFAAGNEGKVRYSLKKQYAVRMYRRLKTVKDVDPEVVKKILNEADCSEDQAERIYRLTSLATFDDRFVIPGEHREQSIEKLMIPLDARGSGLGFLQEPERKGY